VATGRKRELLAHLVSSGDWRQVLVFTRTKHGANRLSEQLSRSGINSTAIHGNKSQPQRTRALADFKAGTVRVLVATDIAARGLDIEELPHVVNFDMPHVAEDYVHRIGRTGRAGSTGEAISLVAPEEQPLLAAVEKLLARRLERQLVDGFEAGAAATTHVHAPKPRHAPQPRHAPPQPRREANHRNGRKPAPNPQNRDRANDVAKQPHSNAGQLFPSSAKVFGEPRPRSASAGARRAHGGRGIPPAAILGGARRRTG
jgi:ATP-dependent RNA helicase RhlE